MLRTSRFHPLLLTALTTLAAGCGAKTGLRLPDVVVDVPDVTDAPDIVDVPDVQDVPDVIDACVPMTFPLLHRKALTMFVIDRSGSMADDLQGSTDGASRWSILHDALAATLPSYENEIDMGAVFFPQVPEDPTNPDPDVLCQVSSSLDVSPGPRHARDVVRILETTEPAGGTPTFQALAQAGDALISLGTRASARYIVLATDGGPNCNHDLDPNSCVCTTPPSMDPDAGAPECQWFNCLDDSRTLAVIDSTFMVKRIPIYVIGIADQSRPDLQMVLSDMAEHGGRPNHAPGQPPYYSVQSSADLVGAFNAIEQEIARCAFVTPTPPVDPDAVSITVAGVPTPRDPSHNNGWDWTDVQFGEVTLYGAACDRALGAQDRVIAAIGCNDAGP